MSLRRNVVYFKNKSPLQDGMATDPKKTQPIKSWFEPKSISDLLDTCAYYRRFIKSFRDIQSHY